MYTKRKLLRFLREWTLARLSRKSLISQKQEQNNSKLLVNCFSVLKSRAQRKNLRKAQNVKALTQCAHFILKKSLQVLEIRCQQRKHLRQLQTIQEDRSRAFLLRRTIKYLTDAFVTEPKMEEIGHKHFLKVCLKKFVKKANYVRGRENGTNLNKHEVAAYQFLGKNLQRKALNSLRVYRVSCLLKQEEQTMVVEYQRRKWFANWRKNYLIRANQNYLMPPHEEKISHLQKSQRIISNLSKPPRYSRTIKPPGYKTVNFLANPVIEQSESFVSQDDFPQENFQANNIPTLDLASHEHNQQSILLSQLKYYHKLPQMISEELNSQNLSVA